MRKCEIFPNFSFAKFLTYLNKVAENSAKKKLGKKSILSRLLYLEQEGFVNLGSASQRKIDPNEGEHCASCKASEEDRFYAGVASPNSQNLPARGIVTQDVLCTKSSLCPDHLL